MPDLNYETAWLLSQGKCIWHPYNAFYSLLVCGLPMKRNSGYVWCEFHTQAALQGDYVAGPAPKCSSDCCGKCGEVEDA